MGTIIDLPSTFNALKGISKALVPLFTATAYFVPIYLAKSFSNWKTFFDGWYDWNGHVSPIIRSLAIAIAIIGFKQFSSQQLAKARE